MGKILVLAATAVLVVSAGVAQAGPWRSVRAFAHGVRHPRASRIGTIPASARFRGPRQTLASGVRRGYRHVAAGSIAGRRSVYGAHQGYRHVAAGAFAGRRASAYGSHQGYRHAAAGSFARRRR